ncbi:MAG: hypothetical protein GXY14_03380 [Spirochaetes bacterium]|nr:hypothetical protein [Spirochaetota bacterium]
MRFLKLVISQPGRGRTVVDFNRRGETLLRGKDADQSHVPDIIRQWMTMLNGRIRNDCAFPVNNELYIESGSGERGYRLVSINKKVTAWEQETVHSGYFPVNMDKDIPGNWLAGMPRFFSAEDMLLLCVHDRELVEQGNDPLFSGRRLASLLLKREIRSDGPVFISGLEGLSTSLEKELNILSREMQILELKMMKKDRLKKETAHSVRTLNRLNRQIESAAEYRETLLEIKKKIEQRDRLTHKISETRKDLMELKEIGDRTGSLEKDLKKRFPQFYNEKSDGLPDMDRIQKSFNSLRDINEKIDIYRQKRKNISAHIIRLTAAFAIFTLLALGFAASKYFTTGIDMVKPLIAAAAASGLLALAGMVAVFSIKKQQPVVTLEEKKAREAELFDLLHKNNFPVDDFKTGEIYDFLFQYFEDFITFRDIRNELADLKKRISSTVTFTEKEKKLDSLSEKLDETSSEIERLFAGLDQSVHPLPDPADIENASAEVGGLIKELEVKIQHEKSVISKLEEQFSEQSGADVNLLEIESEMNDINTRIESLKAEAETARFLEETFREASEPFLEKCIEEFTTILSSNISRLMSYRADEKISAALTMLFDPGTPLPELDLQSRLMLSLGVRSALSAYFARVDIPPVLIVDPVENTSRENVEEFNKILLELFGNRQVIIFTSGTDSGTDLI